MVLPIDPVETIKLGLEALRGAAKLWTGVKRAQLQGIEEALGDAIASVETFDKVLQTNNWPAIGKQGEETGALLKSLADELRNGNIDKRAVDAVETFGKAIKVAGLWQEYNPDDKGKYQNQSPAIVDALKKFHTDVKEKLSSTK